MTRASDMGANAGAREITLKVAMACDGCAGAVRRICARDPKITSVECDVEAQLVTIRGDALDVEDVRERVAKCGKATEVVGSA